MAMAMLRSAIRLASRQSAPASRFLGNAARRSPASSITARRNYYFSSNKNEFVREDFTNWNGLELLIGSLSIAVGMLFYHNLRESRYNRAPSEKKSTSDTGHYEAEAEKKKKLSEASMSN